MKGLTVLVVSFCLAGGALAKPQVGTVAPDFKLPGHDGKTYSLTQQTGKYVVLEWFNDDCPYVEKHYDAKFRNMQNLQKKWISQAKKDGKELVWFAIVSSAPGKQGYLTAEEAKILRNQKRKANMNAILFDPKGQVGRSYAAKTTPHMFIVDDKGILRYDGAIDDRPSTRLSSLKDAKNYIDSGLTALLADRPIAQATTKPYGCSVKYD